MRSALPSLILLINRRESKENKGFRGDVGARLDAATVVARASRPLLWKHATRRAGRPPHYFVFPICTRPLLVSVVVDARAARQPKMGRTRWKLWVQRMANSGHVVCVYD